MNFWKRIQQQILGFKQVGDAVNLSGMTVVKSGRVEGECPLCHEPTDKEIESGSLYTFTDEDLCLKHLNDMRS